MPASPPLIRWGYKGRESLPPPPGQIIQLHVEVVIKGTVIVVWLILSILPMVTGRFDANLCSEIARKF